MVKPGNIYITGDTHGDFERIKDFCNILGTTKNDVMIVLGDAGVNYFLDKRDRRLKREIEKLPITFMFVRGNHEARPGTGWDKEDAGSRYLIDCREYAGTFMMEREFPSLLYMLDGGEYTFTVRNRQLHALVIGGAYSVDKDYRLEMYDLGNHDFRWFKDEQLSREEMLRILDNIRDKKYDYVFSHTCPISVQPSEGYASYVGRSAVDKSMEQFLEEVKNSIRYENWYCGHWHMDRNAGDTSFMFNKVAMLGGFYDSDE